MNNEIVILIVDDIEVNRVILKGIFEQDYKVIEADDGTTALDILNRGTKVDIILLDIIMPVMNGIDFLKEIKKNKSYSEIPVIVNTQAGEQENEYKALANHKTQNYEHYRKDHISEKKYERGFGRYPASDVQSY